MVRKYLFAGLLCLLFQYSHSRSMMTTRMVQNPVYPIYNGFKQGEIIKFSDANQGLTVIKDPMFGACFINKHDPLWLPEKADKEYFTQNFDCDKVDESISYDELSSDAGPIIASMCRDAYIFKVFADYPPPPPMFGMKEPPKKQCEYQRTLPSPHIIDTSNNSGNPSGSNIDNGNSNQAISDQNGSNQQNSVDSSLTAPNKLIQPPTDTDQIRSQALPLNYGDQSPSVNNGDLAQPLRIANQVLSVNNGDQAPPINNGDQAPPMNNGDQAPPMNNVDQAPPMFNGDQAPPMKNIDQAPPINNGDQAPPLKNGDQAPPMNNVDQAPPMNNVDQAPPMKNGDQAPPMNNVDQAPPMNNVDQAPPMNNGDQAPPLKVVDQTQPLVNFWHNGPPSLYSKSPFSYNEYQLLPFLLNSNSGIARPLSWRTAEEIQSSSNVAAPSLLENWRELWSQGITFAPPKPNTQTPPMPLALRRLLDQYK
ncbi:hypothetical protein ACF0H5_020414 [Mactra antiquata]